MAKIVYVSYPASGTDAPAAAEQALGLPDVLAAHGHQVVTTTDTGDDLDRELADADVSTARG